jgi:hypothetical protein
MTHDTDSDCTLSADDDCCVKCGVYHGDECPDCGGRGFHTPDCSELCPDCGEPGERRGHMSCQYPSNVEEVSR